MSLRRLVTVLAVCLLLVPVTMLTGCGGAAPTPPKGGGTKGPKPFSKADFDKDVAATKSMSPDQAATKLAKLALDAFDADEREPAKIAMDEALKRMGDLTGEEPAGTLVEVWAVTAPALYKVGKREEARGNLKKAVETAGKIEKSEQKALALSKLASAQHGVTQTADAVTTLKKAEELSLKEEDSLARLGILSAVASGAQSIGKGDEAERVVKSMLEVANAAGEPETKVKYLDLVGTTQAAIGKRDAAAETFKQSKEAAESVKDPLKKAFAIFDVGEKMFRAKVPGGRDMLEAARTFANNEPALKNKQGEFKVMYEDIARLLK